MDITRYLMGESNKEFRFILDHITDIVYREHDNRSFIQLYHVGDCWAAFEMSAYFLCQVIGLDNLSLIDFPKIPLSVIVIHIPDSRLEILRERFILVDYKENIYQSFSTAMSSELYEEWRKIVIEKEFGNGLC